MNDTLAFLFCFLTQIVINVVSVIIMSNISVVEYQINIITSAIWAQLINAAGKISSSTAAGVRPNIMSLIFILLEIAFVAAGLVLFIATASFFFDEHNNRRSRKVVSGVYGVLGIWRRLLRSKTRFRDAAVFNVVDSACVVLGNPDEISSRPTEAVGKLEIGKWNMYDVMGRPGNISSRRGPVSSRSQGSNRL